jgi:hypothetical protein
MFSFDILMKITSSSIKKTVSKGLENKYVLYFVLFLAISNLLGYAMIGDLRIIAFFILIAFIVSKFSKNMILILGSAMIATNFFLASKILKIEDSSQIEGMQNQKKKKSKKERLANINKNEIAKHATKIDSEDDDFDDKRVDYATTVEQAYDNLENIIGKGGIGKLTDDTSRLMDKQNKLFENLKGMGPLIQQYKEMMGNMNMDNINKLTSTLMGK